MSEESIAMVRAFIDAYNRRDWDSALKDAAPDFELDNSRALGPDFRSVYSLDQVRGFFDQFADPFESNRMEPHEFIEAGEHVVVPLTFRMAGRDEIEVQARVSLTFTIRDGAIERTSMYQEREEALEAVGLAE